MAPVDSMVRLLLLCHTEKRIRRKLYQKGGPRDKRSSDHPDNQGKGEEAESHGLSLAFKKVT